jgi:hypothetical protein
MPFNPITDASLVLRLDGTSPFYKDTAGTQPCGDGDLCAYWGDLSGNGFNATLPGGGTAPTYHSSLLGGQPGLTHFGASGLSCGQPAALVSALNGDYTVIVAGKFQSAAAGFLFAKGNYADQRSIGTANSPIQLYVSGENAGGNLATGQFFTFGTSFGSTFTQGGTPRTLARWFRNGSLYSQIEGNPAPSNASNVLIGSDDDGLGWPSDIYAVFVYSRALLPSEVHQVELYIRGLYGLADPLAANPYALVWSGDSQSVPQYHSGAAFCDVVAADLGIPRECIFCHSYVGCNLQDLTDSSADADATAAYLQSLGKTVVSVEFELENTILGAVIDAPTAYGLLTSYGAARRTAGQTFVTATCMPLTPAFGGAGYAADRDALDVLIRSDPTKYDGLADVASDTTIGPATACSDPTLYGDTVHLTPLGYTIAAPYFSAAITAALPTPTPTPTPTPSPRGRWFPGLRRR